MEKDPEIQNNLEVPNAKEAKQENQKEQDSSSERNRHASKEGQQMLRDQESDQHNSSEYEEQMNEI